LIQHTFYLTGLRYNDYNPSSLMRIAAFLSLAVLALANFVPAAGAARAETAAPSSHSCGVTPREAIAAAEKALTGKEQESQMRAIACLLAAVKRLEADRLKVVRAEEEARMLRVPRYP
jgi:hypothetical protein